MYNITALQNASTIYDIFSFANSATNGLLFGGLLIATFFILLMMLKRWDFDKALLVDGFACFILSLMMANAHLISFLFVIAFASVTALSLLYMAMARPYE